MGAIGKSQVFSDIHQAYSLPALIAQGRAIEVFYRDMALEAKNGGYVIRKDLFDKLLSDYYVRSLKLRMRRRLRTPESCGDWPDPAKKWALKPTEAPGTSSTLVNRPVELCTIDKKNLEREHPVVRAGI